MLMIASLRAIAITIISGVIASRFVAFTTMIVALAATIVMAILFKYNKGKNQSKMK